MRYAVENLHGGFNIGFISDLFPSVSFSGGKPDSVWMRSNDVYSVIETVRAPLGFQQSSTSPYLLNGLVYTVKLEKIELDKMKAAQTALATLAYKSASVKNVSFTSSTGVAKEYQTDDESVANLTKSILGCAYTGKVPLGFYWLSFDNAKVPFTYEDLQGLSCAIFTQTSDAFNKLQSLKLSIKSATTNEDVLAVVWG